METKLVALVFNGIKSALAEAEDATEEEQTMHWIDTAQAHLDYLHEVITTLLGG
jgi:flagellin-specific chaperone FliS